MPSLFNFGRSYLNERKRKAMSRASENASAAVRMIQAACAKKLSAAEAEFLRDRTYPRSLNNFERSIFSQNGEDGIIQEIFSRIGIKDRFFVEFGVQDGTENCTRYLLEACHWRGVWFEGDAENCQAAEDKFRKAPVAIYAQMITRRTARSAFQKAEVPAEFDLLVIDIDSNDYAVWKKLAAYYSPRVVVIEYNASFLPDEFWIMSYDETYWWDGSNKHGASLLALADLGKRLGYVLVGSDLAGVNAFFVKASEAKNHFDRVNDVQLWWNSFKLSRFYLEHPPSPGACTPVKALRQCEKLKAGDLHLELVNDLKHTTFGAGSLVNCGVYFTNNSSQALIAHAVNPLSIAYQWFDTRDNAVVEGACFGSYLLADLVPGEKRFYLVRIAFPARPGTYRLQLSVAEEGVQWCQHSGALIEKIVTVV